VVRLDAQDRVQREIRKDALSSILAFQALQHEHEIALTRKADLLASLAFIRNGDASAVQDVGDDPWQSGECDLLGLAGPKGKIVALHTKISEFPLPIAQEMFAHSFRDRPSSGWWYSGARLYQVVLLPYYDGVPSKSGLLGTVIVGREIDAATVSELGRASSSQVAFRYGNHIVATTLPVFKEQELEGQLQADSAREHVLLEGERFFVSSANLPSGAQSVSIVVLKSYSEALAFLKKQSRQLVGLGLLAVLAGSVLVFLISDRFTRPLGVLVEGVNALERGNFVYPLEAHGEDEVAQVTRAFDSMRGTLKANEAQKQQLEEQLRQSQKMDAIGRLAGGVAHDFNNLLTVIKGHGDLMLDRLQESDPMHKSTLQINKAADRATSLTRQLLAFCRMQVLQPKILDLNTLVAEMYSLLRRLVREDISFTFQGGESLSLVKADPSQIEQIIMNLTVNACDAMPVGGRLTIQTNNIEVDESFARTRSPMLPGEYVRLSVIDTGCGMDANTKARIFEPFFTTKEQGKGTGLGLATVYGVVKQSGGYIWVDSEPGAGTTFEVYLPAVNPGGDAQRNEEVVVPQRGAAECVLLVEDEDAVRDLAADFLKSAGYIVLSARNGAEALTMFESADEPIDVLVTDVVMPHMRGEELARRLKSLSGGVRIIYMSGYLDYHKGSGDFLTDAFFLQKPFSRTTLVQKVNEALSHAEPICPTIKEAGS
jgi:signal transduction histidine kinase